MNVYPGVDYNRVTNEVHATVPDPETGTYVHVDDPVVCGKAETELRGLIEKVHSDIFSTIKDDTYLLNMDRIEQFYADKGMQTEPLIVVRKNDLEKIAAKFEKFDEPYIRDANGLHSSKFQLGTVHRSDLDEMRYGREFTEMTVVHEKGHGTSEFDLIEVILGDKNLRESAFMPNMGFRNVERRMRPGGSYFYVAKGDFFEEAFAEEMSAQYAEMIRGRQITGLGGKVIMQPGGSVWLPERFLYMKPDEPEGGGRRPYTYNIPSFAAAAMYNFGKIDTEIPQLLEDARSSKDAVYEVHNRVNGLLPKGSGLNLSGYLHDMPYEQGAFVGGLRASYQIAAHHGVQVVPDGINVGPEPYKA